MKNHFSNNNIIRLIRQCSSSAYKNIRKPLYLMAIPGKTRAHIMFWENGNELIINNYQYSVDNGKTYKLLDPPQTFSPITINELNSGTTYNIILRGINDSKSGPPSTPVTVTPIE